MRKEIYPQYNQNLAQVIAQRNADRAYNQGEDHFNKNYDFNQAQFDYQKMSSDRAYNENVRQYNENNRIEWFKAMQKDKPSLTFRGQRSSRSSSSKGSGIWDDSEYYGDKSSLSKNVKKSGEVKQYLKNLFGENVGGVNNYWESQGITGKSVLKVIQDTQRVNDMIYGNGFRNTTFGNILGLGFDQETSEQALDIILQNMQNPSYMTPEVEEFAAKFGIEMINILRNGDNDLFERLMVANDGTLGRNRFDGYNKYMNSVKQIDTQFSNDKAENNKILQEFGAKLEQEVYSGNITQFEAEQKYYTAEQELYKKAYIKMVNSLAFEKNIFIANGEKKEKDTLPQTTYDNNRATIKSQNVVTFN